MSWKDNLQKVNGIANRRWASTHLGTYAGGTAEGYWGKKKKKIQLSFTCPAA